MFILNCTRDFQERIIPDIGDLPSDLDTNNQAMEWVLHVFQAKRKNCIVAMNVMSRYSILFADVKKQNITAFFRLFIDRLMMEMSAPSTYLNTS